MPPATDPRLDAYLANAAPFARPILAHLRALVHRAVPDATETIKWGMPFFTVDGTPLCNLAVFKAHAAFGFWRRDITEEFEQLHANGTAMGAAGRITSLADLPPDKVIVAFLKRPPSAPAPACRHARNAKSPRAGRCASPPISPPR